MAYEPQFAPVEQHQRGQTVLAYGNQDQQDNRLTDTISHSMASGSVNVTEDQMRAGMTHLITSCTVAGRVLTIPAGDASMQGPLFIASDSANTQSCQIAKGTTLYAIAPGEYRAFWNDPDENGLIEIAGSGGGSIVVPTSKRKTYSGARVGLSGIFAETQSTWSKITWATEYHDDGGWHAASPNERLTVPAGVTKVRLALQWRTSNNAGQYNGIEGAITKNGDELIFPISEYFYDGVGSGGLSYTTPEIDVVAGDYFEAWVCFWESTNTLAIGTQVQNHFSIWAVDEAPYGAVPTREIVSDYIAGTPTGSSVVYEEMIETDLTLLDDFAGAAAHCGTNPSGTTAFDVQVNGSSIGSVSFSTGGVPTFSTTGADTEAIAAGQRFSIVAPASLNSIADLAFTFKGYHA